jgi:subtilase family serine protease
VIKVTTSVSSVESFFNTKMVLFEHENPKVSRLHLKSRDRIQLPESVAKYISFTSLDSPVHINLRKETKRNDRKQLKSHKSIFENAFEVGVLGRNFDALLFFNPSVVMENSMGSIHLALIYRFQSSLCSISLWKVIDRII